MISEYLDDIDIIKEIDDLLEFEKQIILKKLNNEELTAKEYFFDTYMFKPSTMIKFISNNKGDEKSV